VTASSTGQSCHKALLRDGKPVFIRLLQPADAALYSDFRAEVTAEDMRLRFHAPVEDLSGELVTRLTNLDPARAAAFVAFGEEGRALLGIARLHYEDGMDGEIAVLIRSRLKGRGLGSLLVQTLIDYARAIGLRSIYGRVLADNRTMLKMCANLGFEIGRERGEPGVMLVTLKLR